MVSLPDHLQAKPVGRHRLSREIRAEHQRERVIEAAIRVFAKRGYQGTTVDHVVAGAKVGVGTFYELFENKQDCFLQAYDRIVEEARERIALPVPADAAWPEQARAALWALLEWIEAEPLKARLALVEVQTAGEEALARYEAAIDEAIPLFARGRDASPVAAELPRRMEEAVVGGLAWFLQQRVAAGDFGSAASRLSDVLEIAVEPYVGEAAVAELRAGAPATG